MKRFKEQWEITQNWQLLFPVLGILSSLATGFLIAKKVISLFSHIDNTLLEYFLLSGTTLLVFYSIVKISLWCFAKLKKRWAVQYRWEFIAVFLVFAVTGSASARISGPILHAFGFERSIFDSEWYWSLMYWIIRLLVIFPVYQILLIVFAFFFGQFRFFWDFEKKMLSRIGFAFLFK
ncbi:DUF6787 family protein [Ascidiimonas aurantiaca]|uniref:DUF6787 family protein n=1 Tax=Ascidiimonas aurantiaca TaxID=1685432 RepID=UPI0030ED2FD9